MVRYGLDKPSSNSEQINVSFHANPLEKGMNHSFLPSALSKIIIQAGIFSLDKTTGVRERKKKFGFKI